MLKFVLLEVIIGRDQSSGGNEGVQGVERGPRLSTVREKSAGAGGNWWEFGGTIKRNSGQSIGGRPSTQRGHGSVGTGREKVLSPSTGRGLCSATESIFSRGWCVD